MGEALGTPTCSLFTDQVSVLCPVAMEGQLRRQKELGTNVLGQVYPLESFFSSTK